MSGENVNPFGNGLNFGGEKAENIRATLARLAAQNARRIPCEHCTLSILPEDMPRHLAVVHDIEGVR